MKFWVLLKVPRNQSHRPGHHVPGWQKVGAPLEEGLGRGVSDYDTESLSVNHSGQRVQRVPCSIVAATKD